MKLSHIVVKNTKRPDRSGKQFGCVLQTHLYYALQSHLGIYQVEWKLYLDKKLQECYSDFVGNFLKAKISSCPSPWVREKKLWHIHTVKYYSTTKRNELLIQQHGLFYLYNFILNLPFITLLERNQTQNATYRMIPLLWYSCKWENIGPADRSVVASGWSWGWLQSGAWKSFVT